MSEVEKIMDLVADLVLDRPSLIVQNTIKVSEAVEALVQDRDRQSSVVAIYAGLIAKYKAKLATLEAKVQPAWRYGMTNDELKAAFETKLPGVTPTDREMSTFALGVEVGRGIPNLPSARSIQRLVDEALRKIDPPNPRSALHQLAEAVMRECVKGEDANAQQHPDDIAVDRFSAAMKDKLAKQRSKGYGGWDDPSVCSVERLQQMLVEHIEKGDPIDIGNFAMMIFNRGES